MSTISTSTTDLAENLIITANELSPGSVMNEVKQRLQDHIVFLSDQGYLGTAKGITDLVDEILTNQIATPEELSKKVIKLFDLFAVEYKNSCPIGRTYRFKCFREANWIVLRAVANLS